MNTYPFHVNSFFEAYYKRYARLSLGDFLLYKEQVSFSDFDEIKNHYKYQSVIETIDRAYKDSVISEEEAILLRQEKFLFEKFLVSLTEEEICIITLERELLFEQISTGLSNSKELEEGWCRHSAILEFFKNNLPEFDKSVVSAFCTYDSQKDYKKNWGQLVCSKCKGEFVYETLKYKKAENAHKFVCVNCSGLTDRGDGLYYVDDAVRTHPYQFLTPKICVTVAGWISEIAYESDQYYFDNMEDTKHFIEKLNVPAGKKAEIIS